SHSDVYEGPQRPVSVGESVGQPSHPVRLDVAKGESPIFKLRKTAVVINQLTFWRPEITCSIKCSIRLSYPSFRGEAVLGPEGIVFQSFCQFNYFVPVSRIVKGDVPSKPVRKLNRGSCNH